MSTATASSTQTVTAADELTRRDNRAITRVLTACRVQAERDIRTEVEMCERLASSDPELPFHLRLFNPC